MINKKEKGFTLVELLAVIVILAIILVIAVPQIMSVIKDSTKASLESSAKMVASQIENQYTVAKTLGKEFDSTGSCMEEWAGLNETDYESCTYEITSDGTAKVTIKGKGKFEGLNVCEGTINNATTSEEKCKTTVTAETFSLLCKDDETCTTNNLLKDIDGNIRYYGADPNNYIEFNNEVWRIIGVFNVKTSATDTEGTKRIKIVKDEVSSETKSFDSNLKSYLKGEYYNSLSSSAKNQISTAVWTYGSVIYSGEEISAAEIYDREKTNVVYTEELIVYFINASDFAYASENFSRFGNMTSNWLLPSSGYYWTLSRYSDRIWFVSTNYAGYDSMYRPCNIRPSVYLNPDITITGTGENTSEGMYKIS